MGKEEDIIAYLQKQVASLQPAHAREEIHVNV